MKKKIIFQVFIVFGLFESITIFIIVVNIFFHTYICIRFESFVSEMWRHQIWPTQGLIATKINFNEVTSPD